MKRALLIAGGIYAIWWTVGLFMLGFDAPALMGHWEDMIFIALAAAVLTLWLARLVGWKVTLWAFGWTALVSGVVEAIGATTGYPFGNYTYTERFGPRLGGLLPVAIPLAWWVVLLPLYTVARRWLSAEPQPGQRIALALGVGIAATIVDLALEPVAWGVRGYWLWEDGGFYYGVPALNFFGWWVTAALIALGLTWLLNERNFATKVKMPPVFPMIVLASVLIPFGLTAGLQWSVIPGAVLIIAIVAAVPLTLAWRWRR